MFVEWSEAGWRRCQSEARIPGPALAPGSARPATGLGREGLGAAELGALCGGKVNALGGQESREGRALNMASQFPEFLDTPGRVGHVAGW